MPSVPDSPSGGSLPLPSLESVRALAGLLRETGLSELSLEDTTGENTRRLVLRRPLALPVVTAPAATSEATASPAAVPTDTSLEVVSVGTDGVEAVVTTGQLPPPPPITVTAPAVGLFQPAEPPLEIGAHLKAKQVLGVVESLKVPNEVRSTGAGVLRAVLCLPGQGVEYGQPLFEIEVESS